MILTFAVLPSKLIRPNADLFLQGPHPSAQKTSVLQPPPNGAFSELNPQILLSILYSLFKIYKYYHFFYLYEELLIVFWFAD